MNAAAALRRAIAATESHLAELQAALAAIEGHAPHSPVAAPFFGSHLKTVKECAPRLRMSEKTLRKLARELGAEMRIGGKIFIDERIVSDVASGKIFPNFSTAGTGAIGDDDCEEGGK